MAGAARHPRHVRVPSISGRPHDAIWAKLESWTEPGVYHLFCHPGEASPELDNLCSLDAGGSPWANAYREKDLAFVTAPSTRHRIEDLGFELVGVKDVFRRS